jgi:hypothetical protein
VFDVEDEPRQPNAKNAITIDSLPHVRNGYNARNGPFDMLLLFQGWLYRRWIRAAGSAGHTLACVPLGMNMQ